MASERDGLTQLYRLDTTAIAIARSFGAAVGNDPWAGGYVAPGRFAPVITAGREFIAGSRPAGANLQPRITPRLWGVMPPPNAPDQARRIATVRNPESPFWIGNLRNSEFRCLIPATAIMLWGSGTDYEGRRLRHWFGNGERGPGKGQAIIAMAGVWKDEDVPAFAILTRPSQGAARAAGAAAMPVIVQPDGDAQQDWLHGNWVRARAALQSSSEASLREIEIRET